MIGFFSIIKLYFILERMAGGKEKAAQDQKIKDPVSVSRPSFSK